MKQVVIINGSGGVGKDTFVKLCKEFIPTDNYSSVTIIKSMAHEYGWNGEKDEKSRKFLSDLKMIFSEYNDLPFRYMADRVDIFKRSYEQILFLHIREPEEIDRAKKEFNAVTLLVTNSRVENITSNDADAKVGEYQYDYYCKNDGSLDDLRSYVNYFITEMKYKALDETEEFDDIFLGY